MLNVSHIVLLHAIQFPLRSLRGVQLPQFVALCAQNLLGRVETLIEEGPSHLRKQRASVTYRFLFAMYYEAARARRMFEHIDLKTLIISACVLEVSGAGGSAWAGWSVRSQAGHAHGFLMHLVVPASGP